MKIDNFDTDKQVFIVAEIGNNHEGSYTLAEEMIGRAAEAGADAVKFQTFIPEFYVSRADASRLERLRRFKLSFNQFEQLAKQAADANVIFFSTPFDLESARFLNTIQSVFKIASGDNTFYQLIDIVAGFGKPMIVSTGLADIPLLGRIYDRVKTIWEGDGVSQDFALLHCVSSYPVPLEQINLGAIAVLKTQFPQATIGYSDHALGIEAATYAIAAGARILEKHFTLDKNFSDFRDHQLSTDVSDFRRMVEDIRTVEIMLGEGKKRMQPSEEALITAMRRSIAAVKDLQAGASLTINDLTWVRPGNGIPPGDESRLIGRKLIRPISQGELIKMEDVT